MFSAYKMKQNLGVFLYLPPNTKKKNLLSEGLGRLAISTALSIASAHPGKTYLLVPRAQKRDVSSTVRSFPREVRQRLKVISPAVHSPASVLIRILTIISKALSGSFAPQKPNSAVIARALETGLRSWLALSLVTASFVIALVIGALGISIVDLNVLLRASLGSLATVLFLLVAKRYLNSLGSRNLNFQLTLYLALERADSRWLANYSKFIKVRNWWIPSAMYSASALLRGNKTLTFADYAPVEMPRMLFEDPGTQLRTEEIKLALAGADNIVCLSEYVREKHLPNLVSLEGKVVKVIPPSIPTRSLKISHGTDKSSVLAELLVYLNKEFPQSSARSEFWWDYPVLVAPTQNRPYKNIQNLVLAVHQINLTSGLRLRLILTCDRGSMLEFLTRHGCEYFVEFLPRISDDALQRVIYLSDLTVSPSLFEGNMPYTLYEGVSLGVPCLLADMASTIKIMREYPAVERVTVFDALNVDDIAQKIVFALENKEQVFSIQANFADKYYQKRSPAVIGMEYLDILLRSKGKK